MSVYTTIRCKCIVAAEHRELIAEVLETPYSKIMFSDRVINTIIAATNRFKNYFYADSDLCREDDWLYVWQEPIEFKYDKASGVWQFVTEINHLDDEEQMFFELFVPRYIQQIDFYESYSEFIYDDYIDGKDYAVRRVVDDALKIIRYNKDACICEIEACAFSYANDARINYALAEEAYWEYVEAKHHTPLFRYMANEHAKYVHYDVGEVQSMIRAHGNEYYLDATIRCKEIFGDAVVQEAWIALDLKEVFKFKRPLNQKDMEKKLHILQGENETELLVEINRQIKDIGIGKYFKNIANYLLGERGRIEVGTQPNNRKMITEIVLTFYNETQMIIDPSGLRI